MSNKPSPYGRMLLSLGAVFALSASASGCATTVLAVGASAAAVAISDKTAGDAIDDAAASAEIKAKMMSGNGFNLADVHVAMSEGFVLLAGTTPTPQDRIEAERRAWTVSAVRNVANELQVGPSRTITQSLKDKVIGTQVRSKFISSQVKGLNYAIETHNGQVYLLGIARTGEELGEAVNEARTINGVQKVVSYVRVDKRPLINKPETPAEAAAKRGEQMGLASPAQPQQTYGAAAAAQPDYAQYEPVKPAYSQQQSYAPQDYASSGTGSSAAADFGPASDGFAGEVRPSVPDVPQYSMPAPKAPAAAPANYSAPAVKAGSGPVVLTPP